MGNKGESLNSDNNSAPVTDWEMDQEDRIEGQSFYEDRFRTKESEFKRITGEDWPGVNYIAETDGAEDDGYDEPIVNWKIRKRTEAEKAEASGDKNKEESDEIIGTFQIADRFTTKESEFKRITGEDWPGVNFVAESAGVDDDGYDNPIENWVIKRVTPENSTEQQTDAETVQDPIVGPIKEPTARPEGEPNTQSEGEPTTQPGREPATQPERNFEEQIKEEEKDKLEEEEKDKLEEEEKKKLEEEEKKKLEEEEKKKLEEELKQDEERLKKIQDEIGKIDQELKPLAAINADFTHDRKELAHDLAEQDLNAENAKSNLIKRIWKGNLFKKYYQKKYEKQYLRGERKANIDGEELGLDEIIENRSGSAIERFVLGATEDMRYIHEQIGKKDKNGEYRNGEKLNEADAETTQTVKEAIEFFATAKIPENGNLEDLKREFSNRIKRLEAENRDQKKSTDEKLINNYLEVAIQARQRAEHDIAIDKVMEGFKVYNADVRNNIRTDAHRDNIDKIVNKIEESKLGRVIPGEVVAAVLGTAWALTQSGARAAAGAGVGIAVSGVFSGLRERNRVTEDRTRMIRDAAIGLEYSGTSDEEVKGRLAKKRAKYEAKLGGTIYDMRPASELIDNINKAQESGDKKAILEAIAEARVRIGFTDSEEKDLISYSSAEKMGDERTRLDMAVIRAEKALSEEDQQRVEMMKGVVQNEIIQDVDENDKDFRKIRTVQAIKQAGKTIAIGSAVFFGSQEVMALADPNKIGIFEKAGLIKTENNIDANETILAGLAGPRTYNDTITSQNVSEVKNVSGDNNSAIERLEKDGWTKTETRAGWIETKQELAEIDPASSTSRIHVEYDGWADNGTSGVYEGNELGIYFNNNGQFVSGMSGNSTMGGEVFNYENLAAAGRIKGYVTVGDAKFEIASSISNGQLTWGQGGVLTTTTGETIRVIGDNGEKLYKYFEVAMDNGVDANGITHIVPFATDVGADTFSGKMQQVVETVVEHPAIYDFTKVTTSETIREVARDVFTGGIVAAPTSRVGLGETVQRTPDTQPVAPTAPASPEPATRPENPPTDTTSPSGESTPDSSENNPSQPTSPTDTERATETEPTTGTQTTGEQTGREVFVNELRNNFLDLVGEEGIEIMSNNDIDSIPNRRIAEWWRGLDNDTRQKVIEFESEKREFGRALRIWLVVNNLVDNN